MITPERLKELIEQGATIYEAKYYNINPVDLSQKIRCINYRYGMIAFEPSPTEKYLHHKYFKNLFETEEDARWELELTATRTETLKLPNYEDVFKQDRCLDCYTKEFAITKTDIVMGICLFGVDFTNKVVEVSVGAVKMFTGELTKENYIEACRLAKKLFLGEEE